MKTVVIDNPVINSPFSEPRRHYKFDKNGITSEIEEKRRVSSYTSPIPQPRRRNAAQGVLDEEWVAEKVEENQYINDLRGQVKVWRTGERRYEGVTRTTRMLLEHWRSEERMRRLFFAQVEALETAIFLTEVAPKGAPFFVNQWRDRLRESSPSLPRMAFKLCTGAGKTAVMGMLIAWHTLNKIADPQNAKFADAFLLVAPGLTIRDRLRVLLPSDPENYYEKLDLVPPHLREEMHKAKIIITNYHSFRQRDTGDAARLTKQILTGNADASPFLETPDQMVKRVCREFGNKRNLVIINDESHHCWTRKPEPETTERLVGEDRKDAVKREKAAHLWHTGLEHIKAKLGIRAVYDLSATPFYLKGSGYAEGTLFPWVVSDFSLVDGIESGIVKVPRVPVADDAMTGDQPTYRNLWKRIRDGLPMGGLATATQAGNRDPKLPLELEGALNALYDNYRRYYEKWDERCQRERQEAEAKRVEPQVSTPPVFILVCQNTQISKLVYDYIAGYEKTLTLADDTEAKRLVKGKLPLFSNVSEDGGQWLHRPYTILVDSEQLDSGEAMTAEFKSVAAREIEEFKSEYRARYPGRDADDLTDEDLLREVMNTVGKKGKLGEQVRCVVSVSMLTEGWDANTVTHVLGVRAFGTQLLCEQVVGRALRRVSYTPNDQGMFDTEYAEVFGVPFSFIPCSGSAKDPRPGPIPTHVHSIEARREDCEITFPRVIGYRFDMKDKALEAKFSDKSHKTLSTSDVPINTENAPLIGESVIISLEELKNRREQEVAFLLAHFVLRDYFGDAEGYQKPWLFPQLLDISRQWMQECLHCNSGTFPQLLLFQKNAKDAADRIYRSVVAGSAAEKRLLPILRPYEYVGSTRYFKDFDTTRDVYATRATDPKCHISHVVCDTTSWEQKMAQVLEDMKVVKRYVKNHNLGFTIPYTIDSEEHQYHPDFIACLDDGHGEDCLNLIIEVTGAQRKDKEVKVDTAQSLWVPAVNNHGGFGRWAFLHVRDPWNAEADILAQATGDPLALMSVE